MPLHLRLFRSGVSDIKNMFDKKIEEHKRAQMENPFSEWQGAGRSRRLSKDDTGYGKPIPGSHTERRSQAAQAHMMMDIRYLCDMIWDCSEWRSPDGRAAITFGKLFKLYIVISDKVVGTLLRARKHGFVYFDGEMLYQRRDDDKVIELARSINTIRARFGQKTLLTGGGEAEPWGTGDYEDDDLPPDTIDRRNSLPGGPVNTTSMAFPTARRHSMPHTSPLTGSQKRIFARKMSLEEEVLEETQTEIQEGAEEDDNEAGEEQDEREDTEREASAAHKAMTTECRPDSSTENEEPRDNTEGQSDLPQPEEDHTL
ncbi:uncharacterized protein [Panulirus ornatus]|uniref:uncharacterized protein n=1 Tax=Panulirus ornatus TaxID=150431 RepID=UPI003A88525C